MDTILILSISIVYSAVFSLLAIQDSRQAEKNIINTFDLQVLQVRELIHTRIDSLDENMVRSNQNHASLLRSYSNRSISVESEHFNEIVSRLEKIEIKLP